MSSQIHDAAHADITNTTVPVGTEIHDKAIVAGTGPTPTGTVDFLLFTTIDCSGPSTDENNVALSAGTAESTPFTPPDGPLSYKVHYDGDGNYPPNDGPCEPLTVGPVGGVVELRVAPRGVAPRGEPQSASPSAESAEGDRGYTPIVAGAVALAIAAAAGAWYAWRRSLT